jgi:uncharacterized membrane protein
MLFSHRLRAAGCLLAVVTAASSRALAFAPAANVRSFRAPQHDSWQIRPRPDEARTKLHMVTPPEYPQHDTEIPPRRKSSTSTSTQPTPVLARAIQEYLPAGTTTAAASLAAAAVILSSLPADAAMSGGRMGGSFSAPRSGGGSMRMAPSRGFSGGGGGYYSAPRTTIITPFVSPFYSPFYNPIVPFYGGGVGAISYSRGPGLFDLLFLGGIGWIAISAVTGALSGARSSASTLWSDDEGISSGTSVLGSGTSVVRLSVALDVPNRDDPNSLLSVLDRLAATANTDSRKGVQNLTSQVALELLRRKSSIQSAASVYKHMKDDRAAQRTFNQWSVQERSKFEQETISKFGGMDTSSSALSRRSASDSSSKATMAVVTLVLSIQGDSTAVPMIRSLKDVEDALRKIAADVKVDDCLTGAEILWTPEDRNEILTRKDIIADYPELTAV